MLSSDKSCSVLVSCKMKSRYDIFAFKRISRVYYSNYKLQPVTLVSFATFLLVGIFLITREQKNVTFECAITYLHAIYTIAKPNTLLVAGIQKIQAV